MLTSCPCCNYDLTGLPAEHRCPECGLKYDAESEAFRIILIPKRWHARFAKFWGFFYLPYFLWTTWRDRVIMGANFTLSIMLVLLIVTFFLWLRWRSHYSRGGYVVAVLPEGVFYRRMRERMIAYSDFASVLPQPKRRYAALAEHSDEPMMRVHGAGRLIADVFASRQEVSRFATLVEQRLEAMKSESRATPNEIVTPPADESTGG